MHSHIEDIRTSRRQRQVNVSCRLNDLSHVFHVFELSARGFSFLCPKRLQTFKKWESLHKVVIANSENKEMINATGMVVHITEFDYLNMQVGVIYTKRVLDRTISGKIRPPRHFAKIDLEVKIHARQDGMQTTASGILRDFTATTASIDYIAEAQIEDAPGKTLSVSITTGNNEVYNGGVQVVRRKRDGSQIVIRFLDAMLDVWRIETLSNAIINQKSISSSLVSMDCYGVVSEAFKALIADWRILYNRLKHALDQLDRKRVYASQQEKELFLRSIEDSVFVLLKQNIARLNDIADDLSAKQSKAYKKYYRENLTVFNRTAPIASSIIDKANGYSGDFETIKQFFGDPYAGDSLFGKLINKFICTTDAVTAHQDRIDILSDELSHRVKSARRPYSFLTLGSGPAEEVLRFIERQTFSHRVNATLLDMDAFALSDFSDRLQYVPKDNIVVDLLNVNVLNIIRKKVADPVKETFDFTYCAGLFDYFSDTVCKRLTAYLINHTKPGGSIIVTNVHERNFTRHIMEYAFGWRIIHRSEAQVLAMVPDQYKTDLFYDRQKTNIILRIDVPLKS